MSTLTFRKATEADCGLILTFIRHLADYEHMTDEVVATEELLREWIFEKQKAQVLFICEDGREIGFALYFYIFSTFLGRAGIHLEDFFILPEYRGKGYGKATLRKLAQITTEEGCGRLEWQCLDWNKPSNDFYLSLGARQMNEWIDYRLSGETLKKLAEEKASPSELTDREIYSTPIGPVCMSKTEHEAYLEELEIRKMRDR